MIIKWESSCAKPLSTSFVPFRLGYLAGSIPQQTDGQREEEAEDQVGQRPGLAFRSRAG